MLAYLTTNEATKRLSLTRRNLQKAARAGLLDVIRISPNQVLYRGDQIDMLLGLRKQLTKGKKPPTHEELNRALKQYKNKLRK